MALNVTTSFDQRDITGVASFKRDYLSMHLLLLRTEKSALSLLVSQLIFIKQRIPSTSFSRSIWFAQTNIVSSVIFKQFHGVKISELCTKPVSTCLYSTLPPIPPESTGHIFSPSEFQQKANETLECLSECFENMAEDYSLSDQYDVQFSSGVLTVVFGPSVGTYVLNIQSPNQQIWLSSPSSGPKRYDFDLETKLWVYRHNGNSLGNILNEEITAIVGSSVDFSKCFEGKMG